MLFQAQKDNPSVCDTYAKNIIERIDYGFSQIEESHRSYTNCFDLDQCIETLGGVH